MMKKFNTFLLALTSAFLIAGCSPLNTTSEETPVINQQANSVAIVLNLTSVGLYNGAKGTANPALFLENTVTVNLKVGDKLPTKEQITSTSKDTEFHSWIYYDKGGILSSTDSVVDGILTYQAHFEFVGEFEGEPSGGGSENTGGKIYFMDATWWNKDGATSSFYAWGGTASYVWPGVVMKLEETLSNSRKIWSIEIDVSSFPSFPICWMIAAALSPFPMDWWQSHLPWAAACCPIIWAMSMVIMRACVHCSANTELHKMIADPHSVGRHLALFYG